MSTSVPKTQKAAFIVKFNAPPEIKERAVPEPKDDELLIQTTATAINPVDWKILDGGFPHPVPAVGGSDGAGKVAAVGPKVKNTKVGDRVFFQGQITKDDNATFQQYTIIPEALAGKTPENVTDDEAGGLSLAAVAALTQLYAEVGLGFQPAPWAKGGESTGKGKSIVILGGSSSVGQYAIQLARHSGFSNIITNASSQHLDLVKKLGATHALDRKTSSVEDYVSALGGKPLDGIVDAISLPDTMTLGIDIYQKANASAKSDRPFSGLAVVLPVAEEVASKAKSADVQIKHIMGMGFKPELRPLAEGYYAASGGKDGWLAKKSYIPNKPEVTPGGLKGLPDALEKNKKGVSGIKVVIRPQE